MLCSFILMPHYPVLDGAHLASKAAARYLEAVHTSIGSLNRCSVNEKIAA